VPKRPDPGTLGDKLAGGFRVVVRDAANRGFKTGKITLDAGTFGYILAASVGVI
jgi:hypothetical protein